MGTGSYTPPMLGGTFKGATVGTSPAYGCSAQMAEVRVNLETGQVKVERIVASHDCGRAINRTQVEGQMHGCVSMGLGEAVMEEVVFPAILNAIYDATGVQIDELPASPERILKALRARG